MDKIFSEIFSYVDTLEIIDTHEHLPHAEDAREKNTDVLREYLSHYFKCDLLSAGLSIEQFKKVVDHDLPLMERWSIVEPYWNFARNTGYGRSLDITAKALYGIDKICGDTIEQLNSEFQKTLKPGHFHKVLKEKSKIKISLLDTDLNCDKTFFRSVYNYIDVFIYPKTIADIYNIEKESDVRICSFDDWLDACEIMIDKAYKAGAVALKSSLAYQRTLKYDRVNKSTAEDAFNKLIKVRIIPEWEPQTAVADKEFQDYMMHYILRLANKRNLTFQFHTGLQEGSGNILYNSDPSLLTNLFLEYPDVDFDIFHIGYPYQNLLSALAKNFPNVYIDMCWAHIISPVACINALVEWLDAVPANKISAFGGDYCFIDAVYGEQYLARLNVSKALTRKVDDGAFDIDRAKEIAKMLFYDNPLRIHKLEGKL